MEDFIDRLADILKSLLGRGPARNEAPEKPAFTDPDMTDAWNELDDYMRTGRESGPQSGSRSRENPGHPPPVDEDLRQDYANLEVPFGSDIEVVKRAYKSLVMRYHPDKHSRNPEQLKIATEITKKINESFERIRSRTERGGRPGRGRS